MKILIINGPNLNFLGIREKDVYGTETYDDLVRIIKKHATDSAFEVTIVQTNHEGVIIDQIQAAYGDGTEGIIINPGAYTHYSYAIYDALKSVSVNGIPIIEVHITDISAREEWRKLSVTAPACDLQITGEGFEGYLHAMDALAALVLEKQSR